jgi:hypothetical protein
MFDARSESLKKAMARMGRPDACFCEEVHGMTLYAEVPTEESSEGDPSVTLDWDRDLEMLPFSQKRAEMSLAEARSLAANLRHAADCALTGELIRESVFLEQAGFGELSVVTGCGEEINLCFGDGDHSFAKFSLITELSIAQANLLASELDSAVDAIEELLPVPVA